jgi:uncharacterized protein YcnI
MRKVPMLFVATGALLVLLPASATAHVTATPDEGAAGGFFTTYFKVGHGCDDSPTREVSIRIPAGVSSVGAEAKPGWTISTEEGELEEPIESEGETITEGVISVTWSADGEPLDPHQFTTFGLSMQLPDEAEEDVVYFPTVQTCEEGSIDWIAIPDSFEEWHEIDNPAPYVLLSTSGGGHDGTEEESEGETTAMNEEEVRGIVTQVVAAEEDDGSGAGTVLGAIGLITGLLALVIAALAYRKTT